MTPGITTARSPALGMIAPFFLAAPLGLILAGVLIATATSDSFVAVNLPRNVAITHGLVIGWLTTSIMGATYQLAPVVMGGNLWSQTLVRVQLVFHLVAFPVFVWSLLRWNVAWMGGAGAVLYLSLVLYAANIAMALKRGNAWSLARGFLVVSTAFLAATMTLGFAYLGTLQPEHVWFGITLGRVSAHAHLGLIGWLAITVMGVGYQLVPMFNVINQAKPRFGWYVLATTAVAIALSVIVLFTDPAAVVRPILALLLAVGPGLWALDQLMLMRHRTRRRVDIQGRATWLSIGFLGLAIALGFGAALGTPLTTGDEPARWLLAYAAAGLLGWFGSTLVGNSYKILSFLVWYHRYLPLVGRQRVPVTTDIYSERAATAVLAVNGVGTLVLVTACLGGSLDLLRAGGAIIAAVGLAHLVTMSAMLLPKKARRPLAVSTSRVVTS